MELSEAIWGRRSVRRYTGEAVSREDIAAVLEAACWAPSGENLQPWYFLALTGAEDLALLRQTLEASAEAMEPELRHRFAAAPAVVGETTAFIRTLGGAPVCILAFLRRRYPQREVMLLSIAAAVENLLLAAHGRGLGACWVGAPICCGHGEAIAQQFGPPQGELAAMITLGYPACLPSPPKRRRGRYEIR